HQERRVDQAVVQVGRDRLLRGQRRPHVTVDEARDPVPVLLQDGLVEVQLLAQRLQAGGGRRAAEDRAGRIARQCFVNATATTETSASTSSPSRMRRTMNPA